MATSNDHPGLPFVQAEGYTRGRPDGPPIWIVIHTMEAGEHSQRAESAAEYFRDPPDGRQVSSHYCADDNSVIQCVDLDDIAWTVGNRPGNYRGINWELSGFANQTREQWLDPFGKAMLAQVAPLMKSDMARFHIPLARCSIADLQAKRPGFTTHNDLRVAFGVTTHTDPGPNFPFDYLFNLIKGEVTMFLAQISGSQSVYISDGQTYRDIISFATQQKLQGIGVQLIVAANQTEFNDLCGAEWAPPGGGSGSGITIADVDERIAGSTLQPPD